MDVQLKDLIQQVRSEGIEAGRKKAAEIEQKAAKDAQKTLKEARSRAEEIVREARSRAEKLENRTRESLGLSARDLMLQLREGIVQFFRRVVNQQVQKSLSPEVMKKVIPQVFQQWSKKESGEMSLELSSEDHEQLKNFLFKILSEQVKEGLTLRPDPDGGPGFRISSRDGALSYDFSADTVAAVISRRLEPEIRSLLESGKGEA